MKAAFALVLVLAVGASLLVADDKNPNTPTEVRLTDLLALPVNEYRSDPYTQAAHSLQALGKEKACALLLELAAKDQYPYQRTLVLCRMLFQAKPKGTFRRAEIGLTFLPHGTTDGDWPLEPVEIVDGVPFFVARGYKLIGVAESATEYVRYCIKECDWSSRKFAPKSRDEQRKALEKLLSDPKLKGKLDKEERATFEAQIY
jgi:hypothetical protein